MIPYEDLVASLSRWRARQGLPSGPGDYLGEPVQTPYQGYVAPPPSGSRPAAAVMDDELEYASDELLEEGSRPGGPPYGEVETAEYETSHDDTRDDPVGFEIEAVSLEDEIKRQDTEADGGGKRGGGRKRR
jgi:hypothetical protein